MKNNVLLAFFSTIALCLLVAFPKVYLTASFDGIKLFAYNVLPCLLPFFFFTKVLTNLGINNKLGKIFKKPCKFLYNTSGQGGFVFVMSILSGYPIGAKLISNLYEDGIIGKSEALSISSFTSTSGPMFMLGTVGAIMLNNHTYGIIILTCHYLSAILNGFLYRKEESVTDTKPSLKLKNLDNVLNTSISDSINGVLTCGAYIAIFYMIATMLKNVGVLSLLSSALNIVFKNPVLASGLSFGLVEMTGGCAILSKTVSFWTLPSICAIITFGGLSVTLQSITFLGKCGIKFSQYLIRKVSQTIIAFLLTVLAEAVFCL